MKNTRNGELETLTRAIVLASADAMPDRVRGYLRELARRGRPNAQAQAFDLFVPLIEHLPQDYVDFALSLLLWEPKITSWARLYDDDATEKMNLWRGQLLYESAWGESMSREFHSTPFREVSHLSGPFLCALRLSEEQGLRLIGTMLDTVTSRWRDRQQNIYWQRTFEHAGHTRAPLPVEVRLPGGPRLFWGSDEVFFWRHSEEDRKGMGAVAAALQALEFWMAAEVRRGRDPEPMFLQVLGASECVAVASTCLRVARQILQETHNQDDPGTAGCLRAALPIICCPHIWRMNWDVRELAPPYALSRDRKMQEEFRAAVASFPSRLPFFFEEDRGDEELVLEIEQRMRDCAMFADKSNYRVFRQGEETWVQWQAPEEYRERGEPILAPIHERFELSSLGNWGRDILTKGQADASLSPEQAIALARKVQQKTDFKRPYKWDWDAETLRHDALAAVAAAVVKAHLDWAIRHGHFAWCRSILLAAARGPFASGDFQDRVCYPHSAKVLAAQGLCALLAQGQADASIRNEILRLAASDVKWITEAVFEGIKPAWEQDAAFCWNLLLLRLGMGIIPKRAPGDQKRRDAQRTKRIDGLLRATQKNSSRGIMSPLPAFTSAAVAQGESIFIEASFRDALPHLPLQAMAGDEEGSLRLEQLFDDLMAWTVRANIEAENREPYAQPHVQTPFEWNHAFFNMAARFSSVLSDEQARGKVLAPVLDSWNKTPNPAADLLHGFMRKWLDDKEEPPGREERLWKAIARHVLSSSEVRKLRAPLTSIGDRNEALALIVFCSSFQVRPWVGADWPHIVLFQDIIEEWVQTLRPAPGACRYLLALLEGPGQNLWPQPAIAWLLSFAQSSTNPSQLWNTHHTGERAAKWLLQHLSTRGHLLRADPVALKQCAALVDELVKAGVPLASQIQNQLEEQPEK